ncbi:hypothetical protein Cs7R123_32550 [Catellatospora sp. TT07R-123]|uniref:DnaB-like helicase N-terminal domain-containing protein n=1 Tax=Catellatospora sp. TT07R-123 TaxID=2733863 RepID=UPI001B23852B|nr:DnaB-like helicase N-terminal domain-containing protein [Catellatospora sp. TT07R-123]GHJ45913.1 hypothetical protein Cs7R123_32550 [Catellatospora sp. TT07R-123]
MADLIMRAEHGILGALLTGDQADLITNTLTADDFGHPAHAAIYGAILDLQYAGYDTNTLTTAVAAVVDRPDVDATWLQQLAAAAPDGADVRPYAQIVMQAAFDRDTADLALPYHAAAETTADPQERSHLARVAAALDARAAAFAPAAAIDPEQDIQLTAPTGAALELHREDAVIADILQHPEQAKAVASWLHSDVFTIEQRRLTFEVAISTAYHGDPIDPVILAWEVERNRSLNLLHHHRPQLPDPRIEPDYTYIGRLLTTAVAVGTAVTVGHSLVEAHVAATLALSAAAAAERALHRGHTVEMAHIEVRLEAHQMPQPSADRPIEL